MQPFGSFVIVEKLFFIPKSHFLGPSGVKQSLSHEATQTQMRMFSSIHKNSSVLHHPSWLPLATPSPKNANSFLGSCADNPAAWDSKGHGPGSAAGRFGNTEHARNSPRLPTWAAKMELRFSCGATESLLNQDTLYPSAGEFGEILLAFLGTI